MARRFGYSRVSTSDQDWSLQLEALTKAGVDDRDIFREKASGANRQRTELRRMLDLLRPGDQATVYRLDRLARSQLHLLQIMEGNCSGRSDRLAHAVIGSGVPWSVRRMASMARIARRLAVSTTDRISA